MDQQKKKPRKKSSIAEVIDHFSRKISENFNSLHIIENHE